MKGANFNHQTKSANQVQVKLRYPSGYLFVRFFLFNIEIAKKKILIDRLDWAPTKSAFFEKVVQPK